MTRGNVGYALIKAGKPGEAAPLLADALAIRREMLPAGHAGTAESLLHLALARSGQGEPARSRRTNRAAHIGVAGGHVNR